MPQKLKHDKFIHFEHYSSIMQHQDSQVSDITIVLKKECAEKIEETVNALRTLAMEIENTDPDNGVVEGTLAADHLPHIRTWPCVEYVRVEFTYIADYPPDDPRNLDPAEEGAEDSED